MEQSHVISAFGQKDFRRFMGAYLLSQTGSYAQAFMLMIEAYHQTHSAEQSGKVVACMTLTSIPLLLYGGKIADQFNPRIILLCTQTADMLLAIILWWLAWSGQLHIPEMVIIASLYGITAAIDRPAFSATRTITAGRYVQVSVATNSAILMVSGLCANAFVALFATSTSTYGVLYLLNGCTFIAVIRALLIMDPAPFRQREVSESTSLRTLFSYLKAKPRLVGLLMFIAWVNMLGFAYRSSFPAIADKALNGGNGVVLGMLSVFTIGAVFGSIIVATQKDLPPIKVPLVTGLLMVSNGLSIMSSAIGPLRTLSLPLIAGGLFFSGYGLIISVAFAESLIRADIPANMHGRISGIIVILAYSAFSSGWAIGALMDTLKVGPTLKLMTLLGFLSALLTSKLIERKTRERLKKRLTSPSYIVSALILSVATFLVSMIV